MPPSEPADDPFQAKEPDEDVCRTAPGTGRVRAGLMRVSGCETISELLGPVASGWDDHRMAGRIELSPASEPTTEDIAMAKTR